MAKQRLREVLTISLTGEYIFRRAQDGWTPVAVEWQREGDESAAPPADAIEEIPYRLQVASDCRHPEENPAEKQVLVLMMEQIVQDEALSKVVEELNRYGHRTRLGTKDRFPVHGSPKPDGRQCFPPYGGFVSPICRGKESR